MEKCKQEFWSSLSSQFEVYHVMLEMQKLCVRATYFVEANAEAPEDLFHVATLLHGDDTEVILLIHPDQKGLLVIVPERGITTKETGSTSLMTHIPSTVPFTTACCHEPFTS